MGSENGTPSSITSAPFFTSACITATVCRGLGSPAVTKAMSAERRAARSFSKVAEEGGTRGPENESRWPPPPVDVLVAPPPQGFAQRLLSVPRGCEPHIAGHSTG